MLNKLELLFKSVRTSFLKSWIDQDESLRLNRRGNITSAFDYLAEERVFEFCKKNFRFPIRLLTEVRGEIFTKPRTPKYTFVVDPIDGAVNFRRGIEDCAFSIAVVPSGGKVFPKNVKFGLVGNIFSGTIYKAVKGNGAYTNHTRIFASKEDDLSKACVGSDLDFDEKEKISRVLNLLKKIKYFRRTGSGTLDLTQVANGAYDAYIDVRDKLTPENFLGAHLIIKEAGGIITDARGKELGGFIDINTPYNIVAAGNPLLHKQIIKSIKM